MRLGFEGPPNIVVHRLEIWEQLGDDARETTHADAPRRPAHEATS